MEQNLEPGDIVFCTVERIAGAIVFVTIDKNQKQGSIIFSEIAPGRIRNIRDYVFPGKKIICKILRISNNNIDLSLRRVTLKEQKEIKNRYKLEKSYKSILLRILEKDAEKTIKKIEENSPIYEFLEEAKENSKILETIIGKEKTKKTTIKKKFSLAIKTSDGLEKIKSLLKPSKNINFQYISAGKYIICSESQNPKKTEQTLKEQLETIEKQSKKHNAEFSLIEK